MDRAICSTSTKLAATSALDMGDDVLIKGGYVLVKPTAVPEWLTGIPGEILTISDCIMEDLPRPESWDWFDSAEEAEARRLATRSNAQVLTVALRPADGRDLMNEMGGAEQPCFSLLRRKIPFAGDVLGFEIVGAEATLDFHSWHCHGYAPEVRTALGIKLDDVGLLTSFADAVAVLEWMLALPAEQAPSPVPWIVVALGSG